MRPRRGALLAAVLAAVLSATRGETAGLSEMPAPHLREPYVVRIGYTTFERQAEVLKDPTVQSIQSYLDKISYKTRRWPRPVKFELSLGNYYQIWSWFKTGQIDAAVASPFVAMLLERDSQALPIVEFSEGMQPGGHFPTLKGTGSARNHPLTALDRYLGALLDAAREEDEESQAVRKKVRAIRGEIRLDLVSHLSSSGFIMPCLHVRDWLEGQEKDEAVKDRFWRLFFENAHLTLMHDEETAPAPVSTIRFSYEKSEPAEDKEFGRPFRYRAGSLPANAPSIPNDVLLVRRQVAEDLVGKDAADRAVLDQVFLSPDVQQSFGDPKGLYREVRWFNPAVHNPFRAAVNQLFSHEVENRELARLNVRWYERGLFDFTIDETMEFLRQDQQNSGIARLAVVLSGGGVKSLYQTVLLDHLYGLGDGAARQLRNVDEDPPVSAKPSAAPADPLTVHTIIGTSGGAMLAFFASQLPQVTALQPIVEMTSSKQLFPFADLPRLMSVLALLALLQAVLLAAKTFNWWHYGELSSVPIQKSGIRGVLAVALLLVLGGAVAIVTTRSEYMESVPATEAVFYILTAVIAHFGVTCIARADRPRSARDAALGRLAGLGLVFGIQLVVVAVAARHGLTPAQEGLHKVSLPSLSVAASAGVLVIAAALVTVAASGRRGLTVKGLHGYVAALTAAVVFMVVAFLPLIALTLLGLGTLLELTLLYWIGLVAAGAVASLLLLYLARAPRSRPLGFLRDGFVELMRDRRGVITTSLTASMVGLFAFCIACWGLLVAPAVYSNVEAVRAFGAALTPDQLWTGRFRTNLVVTGTLLRERRCSPTNTVSGGLYFCFEGSEGCGTPGGDQWKVFRQPAPARAVDAVFASGSAFPVFPPHLAHLPDGCEVRLVDGGYAHNVPLEAAAMSDARQVLILNASPDPLDGEERPKPGWRRFLQEAQLEGGQLVRSSPDLLSFMFERAQELDRNIGGGLVVASITPRPSDGWWPFLLDFRPDVRKKMLQAAREDIDQERRIGHVLSWGRPALKP